LTEQIVDEGKNIAIIPSTPSLPYDEKIPSRTTIVYETLVDPAVIKIAAENLKLQLFAKYGFLRPAEAEISVTGIEKYYEPYIIISGKYSIDYYRKRSLNFPIDKNVTEIAFPFTTIQAKTTIDVSGKEQREIMIQGDERVKNQIEASLALNGSGRDISLKDLPSAPSEKDPEGALSKTLSKPVSPDLELSILRTRIFKRPDDISWIANETFQVTERLVIYTPRFRATYKHNKTGQEKAAEFDGVTGRLIHTNDSRITTSSI